MCTPWGEKTKTFQNIVQPRHRRIESQHSKHILAKGRTTWVVQPKGIQYHLHKVWRENYHQNISTRDLMNFVDLDTRTTLSSKQILIWAGSSIYILLFIDSIKNPKSCPQAKRLPRNATNGVWGGTHKGESTHATCCLVGRQSRSLSLGAYTFSS
jgi:hypothetical protein